MAGLSPAALVESLPDPALVVGADGTIRLANGRFEEITGDVSGRDLWDLEKHFTAGFPGVATAVEAVLDGEESRRIGVTVDGSDGEQRFQGDVRPILEDGIPEGALIVFETTESSDSRRTATDCEQNGRFYRVFERHSAPMLLIEPESGVIENANDAAVSFYGYSRDRLTSMHIQEINCSSPEEVAEERERASKEARNHFNFEHELASGERRPVEVHSSPIAFDDEELLFSIVHDVTEREKHKDALERERAFVDSALNALTDIFYVADQTGRLYRWNDRVSEVTGYDDPEIATMDVTDFFAESDVERVEAAFSDALNGEQISREFRLETKSGEQIPHEFTGMLLTDEDDDPIGVAGIGRDITERKAREQNLRQLRRAIEAAPHGIFLTDPAGHIEYVNPAFEEMTGYTQEEVLGQTPQILKSGEHDEAYYENLWETITAGEVWRARIVNERKVGERYHAHQTIAPITDEDDRVTAFVAIQTDITGREERQQHFRVLGRVLRHNLQNDLSVIRSYAEQIGRHDGHAEAVEHIVEKTDDILETARKERKIARILAEEVLPRELDVSRIVEQAVTDVRQNYPDASIRSELPDTAPAIADSVLKSAVVELIENAVVHNDESVEVTVSVTTTGEAVELQVVDDGSGIPDSEQDILETGREIDPLYHGTGLGLWFVYWIVRRSGGTLSFTENDPTGSVVTIGLKRERDVEATGYLVEK